MFASIQRMKLNTSFTTFGCLKLKLSAAEKLIIGLLCDSLKDKESEYDTEFINDAIFRNMTWAIPLKYDSLDEKEELPLYVREVFAILETYQWIQITSHTLGAQLPDVLSQAKGELWAPPVFDGFDGNNESAHLGAARMLVERLDRFNEQAGNINNTHAPRREAYIRVANAFMKLREKTNEYFPAQSAENLAFVMSEGARRYLDRIELNPKWLHH